MRTCPSLLKNARLPQSEAKVPFVEILPLKLRNFVSGKGSKTSNVACIQELSVLFACLKTNDFDQSRCAKEVSTLNGCYKTHLDTEFARKAERRRGEVSTGNKLRARQLNVYLRQYPTP